jgi:hypothetical protein
VRELRQLARLARLLEMRAPIQPGLGTALRPALPLMARTDPRPNYGSKRRVRTDGYVDIYDPEHPLARHDGYVFEHRQRAWDRGLLLDARQQIHHRNGDRQDNRIENLAVVDVSEHTSIHIRLDGLKGTAAENARKTNCKHGHPFTPENTYRYGSGRACRTCAIERATAFNRAKARAHR